MHIRLIGGAHDVTGFALAGVEAEECHTRAELIAALDVACHDRDVAIIIVSPELAALGPDVIEDMRQACHLPITVVLPRRVSEQGIGA